MRLQLRKPLLSGDIVNTLGNIRAGTEIPDADKLDSAKKLSSYFPKQPVKGKLHLVVQVPPSGKYRSFAPSSQWKCATFISRLLSDYLLNNPYSNHSLRQRSVNHL